MEFRLIDNDIHYKLENIDPSEILSLVEVLKKSRILEEEGDVKSVVEADLFFDAAGGYFYLNLETED